MTIHTVQQGECLSTIAKQYGFSNWQKIYHDPQNDGFRRLRPDPNVLYPGDQIAIPDKVPKKEQKNTEQKHRFILSTPQPCLRIVLKDENDEAFAKKKYCLKFRDAQLSGTTDDSGMLEQRIPIDVVEVELDLTIDDQAGKTYAWSIEVGFLDPIEQLTGVQGRLNNLGFDCGEVDGIMGPRTSAALSAFQAHYGLKVDGIVGPETRERLMTEHGC
jgi:hypothetical protein